MAGGYKNFGPTNNTTPYVRLGYEGILNGAHDVDPALATEALAGKFATIGAGGVTLAGAGGLKAVGLFREDLSDMVNASHKATFYFRGGEYYVAVGRTAFTDSDGAVEGTQISGLVVGDEITSDASGKIKKKTATDGTEKALGVVTHIGAYPAGNMYANAGLVANGDTYIGFILLV